MSLGSTAVSEGRAAAPGVPRVVVLAVVAAAVLIAGILAQPALGWAGLLTAALYGLTLSLGAALFVGIHAVSGARWWFPVRHVCIGLMRTLAVPAAAVLLSVGLGLHALYPWSNHAVAEASPLIHGKAAWLNTPFFLARALTVIVIWALLASSLTQAVRRAFSRPDERSYTALVRRGALFLVLFALSISVAYWDWAMSLEPEWFSTMYGVYGFAGALQGGVAIVVVMATLAARQRGTELPPALRHDLGKLLFGFSMFWAYIWFSESMLIWYANLPEETGHFATRLAGGWSMLFWLNPVVCFVVPFGLLLSQRVKRHAPSLFQVGILVLVGRWLDVWLLVTPSVEPRAVLPVYAVAATILVLLGMWALYERTPAPEE